MNLHSLLSAPARPLLRPRHTHGRTSRAAGSVALGVSLAAGVAMTTALPAAAARPAARTLARPATAPALAALPAPPSKQLPSELDIPAPYIRGHLCAAGDKPGPVDFAKLLNATYGSHVWGITRSCGDDHGEGRALDWMVNGATPDGLALGNAITSWLVAPDAQGRKGAMARRFGISYLIWNRRIWGTWDLDGGWKPYTGSSPHTDHIHITFSWDGAYRQTSWWTGRALTATRYTGPATQPDAPLTPSGYPHLRQGAVGPDVALAQRVIGASADGEFGPLTAAALASWQAAKAVPVTRELDNATWTKMVSLGLIPARSGGGTGGGTASDLTPYVGLTLREGSTGAAVAALQRALGGLTADGVFGPLTRSRVEAFQREQGLAVTGVVTTPTWNALIAAAGGASSSARPVLRLGSTGAAVRELQSALGGLVVDGVFGQLTRTRVEDFQRSAGLPVTGVVDAATWDKLDDRTRPLRAYYSVVLRRGSTGSAVVALQRGVRVAADGAFGPLTEAAVKNVQRDAGLAVTGVVTTPTWQAVERQM